MLRGRRRRPRVVLAAESLARGASGIGRVARLMARVLHEQDVEARGLALRSDADAPIPSTSMRGSRLAMAAALHTLAPRADACLFDFAGIARARVRVPGLRTPVLCWMHGIEVWEGARADHLAALRAADVLVANSAYTLERARVLHPGLDRAQVCWLGTEQDEPAARPALDGPARVLILGRMDAREDYKGHRELIEAWPAVLAAVPEAELIVAGEGSGRARLQRLVAASSARERVRFVGFVPEPELDALWSQATVLAMPSRGEGFGLTYIEAMRRGVPVVASIHDAAPEINLDGVTGYNVSLDRRDELAERIVTLLRDRDLAQGLGRGGLERWRQHFRYGAFRDRFAPLLARLTGMPGQQRVSSV